MKGIVLAGGSGTRLHPVTIGISKQLLPIYDKPMIYYPISVLIQAGIFEILIISTSRDIEGFKGLLGDGSKWGIQFFYEIQEKPEGLAQAFVIGEKFIGKDDVCLVLGDNLFYGSGLEGLLQKARKTVEKSRNACVFGYYVADPNRYGVAEFDAAGNVLSIEEKPSNPRSNHAVVGLYFYPNEVVEVAKNTEFSERGELEITSVNNYFLQKGRLSLLVMDRGYAWLDTGTHESLYEATEFVRALENRQGLKIGCIEEKCLEKGYISVSEIFQLGLELKKTNYGNYLMNLGKDNGKDFNN